ncbi:hypothetical protein EUTSA_v10003003mg [Eutrema salsugineum]|uniref:DUF4408 domain-containing protein n=1 Tax=Eutrema salsugineum TaxID=72664 RepID=V4MX74_EUTSA|nr:hypothetical protein EUTSA_v10003003mg [Eutrema salsugineum]
MEFQKQEREVKKMKRFTRIIALASIFSFILSYSSLISSLQQRLHLLSMYSNLVDKKYMFLLCNGIVGFILGNFRGSSETLLHSKAINIVDETKEVVIKDMRESKVNKVVAVFGEKSASKEEEEERVDLLRGEEVTLLVEDDEGIIVQDLAIMRIDDNDHDGADNDDDDADAEIDGSLLSSEDLNKKCEEFIRKVKAEIRFESRKSI